MISKYILWNYLSLIVWLQVKHLLIAIILTSKQIFVTFPKTLSLISVFIIGDVVYVHKLLNITIEWLFHLLWVLYCSYCCIILFIKKLG